MQVFEERDCVLQEVLQDNVMPLVYLYLGHPHRSVATAAHTLFCALLQAADEVCLPTSSIAQHPNILIVY